MKKPLCSECRHCRVPYTVMNVPLGPMRVLRHWESARCALTDAVLGTGDAGLFCSVERSEVGECGADAAHFEPKPPPPPPRPSLLSRLRTFLRSKR